MFTCKYVVKRKCFKYQPSSQSSGDRVLIRKRRVGGTGLRKGQKVVHSYVDLEAENGIWNEKGYFWELR